MTGPGVGILRESGLGAADVAGLLPAAAAAGAQVRSVLDASASLPTIDRPRAMVVVGGDADGDAAFLSALAGAAPAPIVGAPFLPPWVGPLDLVVVLAGRADDESAAESAGIARRRGATTIVRGAESGPVAEAAGPSLIAPVVGVPEALATCARWSLLAVVAGRAGLGPRVDLARTADLLDAISLACHPAAETFLNPGVNLAEYLGEGTPLLIGCDRLGDAIARHGMSVLGDLGGVAAGLLTAEQAALSPGLLRRAAAGKDLFADPFDDEPSAQIVKPLLVSTTAGSGPGGRTDRSGIDRSAADRMALAGMLRSFSGAMHLDGSPDSLPTVAGPTDWDVQEDWTSQGRRALRPEPVAAPTGQPADAFDAAVAACVRLDFAAVYVGVATGQLVPLDFPDGLGRVGGTRWAVRPATVGGSREREQGMDTWN